MLEMIFENSDLGDYDYYLNENQNNYKEKNQIPKYHVEIDEHIHQVSINVNEVNDDELDWGYYIDLDTYTPPNKNYSKSKNSSPMLNLPKKNYTTSTKPVKYLPTIEEEMYHKCNKGNKGKSYIVDDSDAASSVISGVTFCATIAFYYFYRNIRN
jgi:hypothetical protein